ncbi:MAG: hypothetical protein QM679_02935 [Patulibacter sp.]
MADATPPAEPGAEQDPSVVAGGEPLDGLEPEGQHADSVELREVRKMRRENAALRSRVKAAEEAERQRADAEKSELQKAQEALAAAQARSTELEQSAARRAAADRAGLPAEFADRLRGSTDEELDEDAKTLAGFLAGQAPPPRGPQIPAGPQGKPAGGGDMNNEIRAAFGRR